MEPKYHDEAQAFRRYATTDPIVRDLSESGRAERDKQTRRGPAAQTRHEPDPIAEQFRVYGRTNKERYALELQKSRSWRPTSHLNEEEPRRLKRVSRWSES